MGVIVKHFGGTSGCGLDLPLSFIRGVAIGVKFHHHTKLLTAINRIQLDRTCHGFPTVCDSIGNRTVSGNGRSRLVSAVDDNRADILTILFGHGDSLTAHCQLRVAV